MKNYIILSVVAVGVLFIAIAGLLGINHAGHCPSCNLPTFYDHSKKSHSCLLCGRIYRLGQNDEVRSHAITSAP